MLMELELLAPSLRPPRRRAPAAGERAAAGVEATGWTPPRGTSGRAGRRQGRRGRWCGNSSRDRSALAWAWASLERFGGMGGGCDEKRCYAVAASRQGLVRIENADFPAPFVGSGKAIPRAEEGVLPVSATPVESSSQG